MPRDNAKHVIAGASSLSPFLGERMIAGSLLESVAGTRSPTPLEV
jgi:hypothetical protein